MKKEQTKVISTRISDELWTALHIEHDSYKANNNIYVSFNSYVAMILNDRNKPIYTLPSWEF